MIKWTKMMTIVTVMILMEKECKKKAKRKRKLTVRLTLRHVRKNSKEISKGHFLKDYESCKMNTCILIIFALCIIFLFIYFLFYFQKES